MNKKKLNTERKKIDQLDIKIFNLIKKRSRAVNNVLNLKKFRNQIIDHKRINEILKKIRVKSINEGVDIKLTHKIWKSMIWSFIDLEKRKFKKK